MGSSFIPFGSVVAASGCSVRVSVACSAGLAASLPLWGLKCRGDSDWAVRAVFPKKVVLLQEGERALLQAELHDADGRGLPSTERLLKAVVLATPAMELPLLKAVDLQREGATDPLQHGKTPHILMPKREVVRFLERIAEFDKEQTKRAARREAQAEEAELERADAVDIKAVLAPGSKRASALAAKEEVADEGFDWFLEEASSDDESYVEKGGRSDDGGGDDDGDDDDDDADDDDDELAALSGAGEPSSEEEEEGGGAGGKSKRPRTSKRASARAGRQAIQEEIKKVGEGGGSWGKAMLQGGEDSDDDEDFVGKPPDASGEEGSGSGSDSGSGSGSGSEDDEEEGEGEGGEEGEEGEEGDIARGRTKRVAGQKANEANLDPNFHKCLNHL